MKTSNKIIATIIALLILIPALVVATIIFRYRNGEFTRIEIADTWTTKELKGINKITVQGLEDLEIIPADSLRLEYDFVDQYPEFKLMYHNDSLHIKGDTNYIVYDTALDKKVTPREVYDRHHRKVKLYLPSIYSVSLISTDAVIVPGKDGTTFNDLHLNMKYGALNSVAGDSSVMNIKKLSITGNGTNITLGQYWNISGLDLDLKDRSTFKANYSEVGTVSLAIDSNSTIDLSGRQFKRIIQKK